MCSLGEGLWQTRLEVFHLSVVLARLFLLFIELVDVRILDFFFIALFRSDF